MSAEQVSGTCDMQAFSSTHTVGRISKIFSWLVSAVVGYRNHSMFCRWVHASRYYVVQFLENRSDLHLPQEYFNTQAPFVFYMEYVEKNKAKVHLCLRWMESDCSCFRLLLCSSPYFLRLLRSCTLIYKMFIHHEHLVWHTDPLNGTYLTFTENHYWSSKKCVIL